MKDKEIIEKVSDRYNLRNNLYQLTTLHFDVNDGTYFEEVLVRYARLIERSKWQMLLATWEVENNPALMASLERAKKYAKGKTPNIEKKEGVE